MQKSLIFRLTFMIALTLYLNGIVESTVNKNVKKKFYVFGLNQSPNKTEKIVKF